MRRFFRTPQTVGNPLSTTGTLAGTLGKVNPFRYRGYYYDVETGFYYLQARYYNPSIGRFISADPVLDTNSAVGLNLYAYCANDPVNFSDLSGLLRNVVTMSDSRVFAKKQRVDLTEKLDSFMRINASELTFFLLYEGYVATAVRFYSYVKDGGKWDIKRKEEWKFDKDKEYYYRGMLLRHDDPGNINFGYAGAVLFSQETLRFGAGMNQIKNHGLSDGYWWSYYDDPRDTVMIMIGYNRFHQDRLSLSTHNFYTIESI